MARSGVRVTLGQVMRYNAYDGTYDAAVLAESRVGTIATSWGSGNWEFILRNGRYTITTDEKGANRISIGSLHKSQSNGARLRLAVTADANAYKVQNATAGVALDANGNGYIDVKLSPRTTYYVWLISSGNACDGFTDGDLVITASGSYGTPATPYASNGYFGNKIPVTLSGGTAGATFTVRTSLAGRTETLLTNGTSTSLTWEPSIETYAPLILNSSSGTATISVDTFYSGINIGTKTTQITLTFPTSAIQPSADSGWVSLSPLNESPVGGFSVYVQRYSKARATFDDTKVHTKYGATIAGHSIEFGGVIDSSSPYDTVVITSTSANIICKVTDSRGQVYSEVVTISLEPYSDPSLSRIDVFRCDQNGAASDSGEYLSAKATFNYSSLAEENTYTLTLYYKRKTDSAWSSYPLTSNTLQILSGFSASSTFDVRIEGIDGVGNTDSFITTIQSQAWAMKFRADGVGVAFGKAPEYGSAIEIPDSWTIMLGTTDLKDYLLGIIQSISDAKDELAAYEPLHLSLPAFSSLPYTYTNSNIKSNMRVLRCVWGTPGAITSQITCNTSDGSLTLSGSMSGSTTADLILVKTN